MTCLAESQILRFFDRTLSPSEAAAVEQHVDECETCRKLLRDVAAGLPTPAPSGPNPPTLRISNTNTNTNTNTKNTKNSPTRTAPDRDTTPPSLNPPLTPGTRIENRYLVLELIGMGGMGRVYAAYDLELDRKVALKLLRHQHADAHERMAREAKALAKLTHPNVIVVYDIGTAFDETFMAMEYVEGRTLRQWLAEEKPNVQRILDIYLEAARGLSAAHAAGLVHRDFKPDNVLIGKDGRARVTDFGLARPFQLPSEDSGERISVDAAPSKADTQLEGTPLYIAPERFAGQPSDARSDQFAFGVALYEALFGEYPFEFKSLLDLPKALAAGRTRPSPRGSRVPRRVRAALLKALLPDPAARYPSVDVLSAALRSAERRTKVIRWALPAFVLTLGIAGTAKALIPQTTPPPLCQGSERRLEGVWDDKQKASVQKALLSSGLPYAESAWNSVRDSMNLYAERWVKAHQDACIATRVYGEQSEEVLDRRTACLEAQRTQLRALSEALSEANKKAVSKAAEAAEKLGDPELCAASDVLRDQMLPPQNEEVRQKVEAVRERLARVRALIDLGRDRELLDEAQAMVKEADALGYKPLQAEAGVLMAAVHRGKLRPDEMRAVLEQALYAAEAGHHERIALKIWLELANFLIWRDGRYDEAERCLKHAEAYLDRLGGNEMRHRLLVHRSALLRAQGRHAEALEMAQKAVAFTENAFGSTSTRAGAALMELGINAHLGKQPEVSHQAFRRAIQITERVFGEMHPAVASISMNYGRVLMEEDPDHPEEYLKVLQRAADIGEKVGGDIYGQASAVLASAMLKAKRYDEALRLIDRAIATKGPTLGPNHPDMAGALGDRASALAGLHRDKEACEVFEQAFRSAKNGPEPGETMGDILRMAKEYLGACSAECCKETLQRFESQVKKPGAVQVKP